jgi:sodium/proline symporter
LPGALGVLIFFVGWLMAGFSVIAQPHIMVRFMALSSSAGLVRARLWYYLWFVVFYAMATAVGMLARIYLPETQGFDAELALPTMALQLLPPVMVGLVLAGIFAATISTADSLLLSCSAFLSQDLAPGLFANKYGAKLATLLATLVALGWALLNRQSVFALVVLSWAMLAVCFVPLIILLVGQYRPPQSISIAVMLLGCGCVLLLHNLGVDANLYVGMPAIICSLVAYGVLIMLYRYVQHR